MAFNGANLVLTGSTQQDGGPYYWVYTTSDVLADIVSYYFAVPPSAFGRARFGDIIRVVASDGQALFRVTSGTTGFTTELVETL